jgi:hypothetical protein
MKSLEEMLKVADVGTLTLEEVLELYGTALDAFREELFAGPIWTRRPSGASLQMCAIVDQALSYLAQAMGAHSRLQYWTGQNGYAIGLPQKQLLQSYTHGSILLRELIDALAEGLEYLRMAEVISDEMDKPEVLLQTQFQ